MPQQYANTIQGLIGQLGQRRTRADARAEMTTEELYGNLLDRQENTVQSNTAATQQALSRLGMARGDDGSGRTGAMVLRSREGANQQLGDFRQRIERLADRRRDRSRGRADSLLSQEMQGNSALLSFEQQERLRRDQQKQAKRQFWGNLAGAALGTAGSLLMPTP